MIYLYIYLVLVNVIDFITTYRFVQVDDYKMESNPMLLWLMEYFDTINAIFVFKFFWLLVLGLSLLLLKRKHPTRYNLPNYRYVLLGACIGYTAVVAKSLYVLITT